MKTSQEIQPPITVIANSSDEAEVNPSKINPPLIADESSLGWPKLRRFKISRTRIN
jgi:hypothetical protein